MTPEEAIEDLQYLITEYGAYPPEAGICTTIGSLQYAISSLEEIQKYREIGTVEECREAVEKQKLKTPGRTGMDEQDCYICPNCGADIGSIDDYFPRDRYCHECGQAIQWNENLEEMEDERD